ncbi:Mediator of RNA polymerase II transcription subunit 10 [Actinomortierella ambigua]|uniref:Mediator of RNA polymerase II transcription subunit 10 n=1 Tax=Actinomortierella ambigua TaxID=1343610 RepID=A0A9P6U4M7_9FUNG|nr:Mediator of RNA polymerase II transcription subunit 10 [Actinomortierella ambigua]
MNTSAPIGGRPGDGEGMHSRTASTPSTTEATRKDLELKLKELIETLLEFSITVYDFQPESNALVQEKIRDLIGQLTAIDGFKDKLDMMIPMEALSFIEDGKNPDLFTQSFVERVAGENQYTNGKIFAMKTFESALLDNLGMAFPAEMNNYQQLLQEAASPMGSSSSGSSSSSVSILADGGDKMERDTSMSGLPTGSSTPTSTSTFTPS